MLWRKGEDHKAGKDAYTGYKEEGARWRSEWDKGRGFRVQRTERRLEREKIARWKK